MAPMLTTGKPAAMHAALACAVFFALMVWGASARADVFTWKDPQTGRTRMSNIPPPWLRDPQPGQRVPKVQVIRENKVIEPAAAFAAPQLPATPSQQQMRAANPAAAATPPDVPRSPVQQEEILLPDPGAGR